MNNALNLITEKLTTHGITNAKTIAVELIQDLEKNEYLMNYGSGLTFNNMSGLIFDNMNVDTINLNLSDLDANLINFDATNSDLKIEYNTGSINIFDSNTSFLQDSFFDIKPISSVDMDSIEPKTFMETENSMKVFLSKIDKLKSDIEELQEMSKKIVFCFTLDTP
jgi:uncharacterized Zn-finger protein